MEGADIVDESGGSVLVPCVAPKDFTLQNFTLSWTFSPSSDPSVDPSALLTYDSRTRQTSMPSEGVELDQEQVLLGNGSLRLLSPESAENTGHYTCTFSALQTRHLVQTWVNITAPHTVPITGHKEGELWVVAVVVGVLALLVIAILLCKRRARRSKQRDAVIEDTESQPMHTVKPVGASTVEGSHLTENLKDTCT
ncbi:uncharacterized protein LOC125290931 isoform X2 [Alosa alosa]|uniref:uncharacterized protein LOC125290931 isoform X2 n=1 Tax=Alosa alosa TaxID=278164 RepID=UPI0020150A4D|nr:uncharacterized protein LOC125290931 isoform X2 [Alosa alosa]